MATSCGNPCRARDIAVLDVAAAGPIPIYSHITAVNVKTDLCKNHVGSGVVRSAMTAPAPYRMPRTTEPLPAGRSSPRQPAVVGQQSQRMDAWLQPAFHPSRTGRISRNCGLTRLTLCPAGGPAATETIGSYDRPRSEASTDRRVRAAVSSPGRQREVVASDPPRIMDGRSAGDGVMPRHLRKGSNTPL
jgi:hypothetical protein